ncbi:MAG: hypothetical protein IPP83_10535 [Flavobacteriales bacterium]|nr:hypothetical protein [Flavobacteriales bacterium]
MTWRTWNLNSGAAKAKCYDALGESVDILKERRVDRMCFIPLLRGSATAKNN